MNRFALLSVAFSLVAGMAAQSNTVPGLDGRLTVIDNLTYYGRRGPAYPNGEIGMAMLNTMCNPGSVNIPWFAAMQPDHPMFGFLVVRVANDKIEQINEWSFCKHAFTSINVNGACGSCQNPGTGSLMGINCSDTYGAGNNASRTWLGPPQEIDPWLGTWEPVGSYFDIGDPMQAGYPAPADGVRSLSQNIFDSVDNRVTVDEIDLTTANADYYYGLQLIHEGESLSSRGDNLAHRGVNPTWNGSSWSFPSNSEGQVYGTILDRWSGASVEVGQNGFDDGRFYVASKVTPLGGGNYHYEYAVHNVDNSRAGGTFRMPVDAGATISNMTFGDIDTDAGNDWAGARVANEIVFTAPPGNALEWNTIYNFGFDADFPPAADFCSLDQARPGPGALWVEVPTQVPTVRAAVEPFGAGCEGSIQATTACAEHNPAGGSLTLQLSDNQYCYAVLGLGPAVVKSFDIWTASTGGTVNVPAHIFAKSGNGPAPFPIATTTLTVGPTEGFYTATFAVPVAVSGTFYLGVDSSAQTVHVNSLTTGDVGVTYQRLLPTLSWSANLARTSWSVNCAVVPQLGNSGLPVPGTSYDLTLSDALGSTAAVLVSGLSDTSYTGGPLPAPLPTAPGCNVLVAPEVLDAVLTSPTGTANSSITVPNSPGLAGLFIYHQWAVLDPTANAVGIALSNGGRATVGN